MSAEQRSDFEKAGEERGHGLLREIIGLIRQNKKYWLIPLVVGLLGFGLLALLGSSSAAPFIYSLF